MNSILWVRLLSPGCLQPGRFQEKIVNPHVFYLPKW